jgi:hypothetical protein
MAEYTGVPFTKKETAINIKPQLFVEGRIDASCTRVKLDNTSTKNRLHSTLY